MRIELSLNSDYVPNWGIWEGLRELISNAKDAEMEFNAPLKLEMRKSGTLLIRNQGASLPRESLLFGYSTKRQSNDMIGSFGEGMKLGVLALIREGYTIKIKNGEEIWTPTLENSEKFNSQVLVFHTTKSKAKNLRQDLDIEIQNIGTEAWNDLKSCFLFIHKSKTVIDTSRGQMLMDQEHQGKMYVKGIFVETIPKYVFGYNFYHADLDRDRKMVRRFDLNWEAGYIWQEATIKNTAHKEQLLNKAEELLEDNAEEVEYFNPRDEVTEQLAAKFTQKYGPEAIPVDNITQSQELEHLGKKGIVTPYKLKKVLSEKFGEYNDVKQEIMEQKTRFLSWHELDETEKHNFKTAKELIESGCGHKLDNLKIAEFADENMQGQYKSGEILISEKLLENLPELIHTLAHEVAHANGGDGSQGHVTGMGKILSQALVNQIEKN